MPARVINEGGRGNVKKQKPQFKAPVIQNSIKEEQIKAIEENIAQVKSFSNNDRAQFYAGRDRLDLQTPSVQRVRELQEENDHLQREICGKESEVAGCSDPLAILADIEHRKILIARNTGEILKIYLKNEERLKRIQELEAKNARIEKELSDMQGKFITTTDLDAKTKCASEFFIMKAEIENNLEEINELNKK